LKKDRTIAHRTAKALTSLTAVLLIGGLAGCGAVNTAVSNAVESVQEAGPSTPAGASSGSSAAKGEAVAALEQLATIPVKGRAPKTGYSREEFGPAWADVDHNGCDTRNDILARDLEGETFKPGTHNCIVLTGKLADKYTGTIISFVRGDGTSSEVQIDHIIPLSLAWQTGAQQIGEEQRRQLANDPLNLMAADGTANMSKGDKDAASWLPSNKAFRCEYVARQTAVKAKYQLWVTQPEHDAIAGILASCK
jgi:hypothetical protein